MVAAKVAAEAMEVAARDRRAELTRAHFHVKPKAISDGVRQGLRASQHQQQLSDDDDVELCLGWLVWLEVFNLFEF